MIQFEKRTILNEDHEIALGEVERLLVTASEYDALYEMLPSLRIVWGEHGDTCTHTSFVAPIGKKITVLVIPPRHQCVREPGEKDEYFVEYSDESGLRVDPKFKLTKGRQRYTLRDCAKVALVLHELMAEQEVARTS